MRPRTLQYGLRSLMIAVTLTAVVFALAPWFDPLATGILALLVAGAGTLAWFCVRDVLAVHITLPRAWWQRRREDDQPGEDHGEQAEWAAARNKLKKRWWARKWPNRYKSYQPGRIYEFPDRLDD